MTSQTPEETQDTEVEEWEKEFIEQGADLEHTRWSKWQAYLHSKCVEHSDGKGEWVCFPADLFKRWERQIATKYADLSEAEKESDREQVRPYLPLVHHQLQKALEVQAIHIREEEANEYNKIIEQELQKARHDWLREEIVKLRDLKDYYQDPKDKHRINWNNALQTIIDRYQAELDQDNGITSEDKKSHDNI